MSFSEDGSGLSVAVVGATGAVGMDLLAALEQGPLAVRDVRLVASLSTAKPMMEVGGRQRRVHTLPADPVHSAIFEDVELVFFCTPPQVTRAHAPALAAEGIAVIDVGGALADVAPLVVPAVSTLPLEQFAELRIACSPSAAAVAVSTALAPLLDLGLTGCTGTVLVSAGMAGRDGVAELSGQVVALFNSREPPRQVFPSGLAFDLLAQTDAVDPETGWTHSERRLIQEVVDLLGLDLRRVALTVAMAPLFSGVAASLHVGIEPQPDLTDLAAALDLGPGVRRGDPVPGPRRLAGQSGVYVGRLRTDPGADGAHLWVSADNLRAGASANAVAIAAVLLRDGLL